jgi:hypothetical protein
MDLVQKPLLIALNAGVKHPNSGNPNRLKPALLPRRIPVQLTTAEAAVAAIDPGLPALFQLVSN